MKKQKTNRFAGKVTKDVTRQKTAASSFGYLKLPKGFSMFSAVPGGKATIDIIPYLVTSEHHPDRDDEFGIAIPGELWYKRPFRVHRNVGIAKDAVVCLTSFGKKCPICEYRTKRIKEGAEKDEIDQLKSSLRNLYCIIPIGDKKLDQEPMIWDMSQYLFQNLLNDELGESPENEGFPDLEEGLSLKIRFDSSSMPGSKPFAEASRIDFESRKHSYDESILDEIPALDDLLIELSYKELEGKFFEMEQEKDEDEDDEPKPVSRNKKSYTKPIPEPDEDEDEDDDEDDDEPAVPVRKSKPVETRPTSKFGKKPAPEPDLDEDDEDDEDDEPEPVKPTRTTKRTITPEPEPDEDEDDEPAVPVRKGKMTEKPKPVTTKNKCPHGHKFGQDCDKFNDCNTCDKWDECIEEQEG